MCQPQKVILVATTVIARFKYRIIRQIFQIMTYLSFRIYYAFKTIGIKAYVLGGLYLAFLKVLKSKMFRYASGGPYLSFLDYK